MSRENVELPTSSVRGPRPQQQGRRPRGCRPVAVADLAGEHRDREIDLGHLWTIRDGQIVSIRGARTRRAAGVDTVGTTRR
jgi:hypothetical protein